MNADLSFRLWLNASIVQQTYQQTFPSLPFLLPFFTMNRFLSDGLMTWGFLQPGLGTYQIFENLSLKTKEKNPTT